MGFKVNNCLADNDRNIAIKHIKNDSKNAMMPLR